MDVRRLLETLDFPDGANPARYEAVRTRVIRRRRRVLAATAATAPILVLGAAVVVAPLVSGSSDPAANSDTTAVACAPPEELTAVQAIGAALDASRTLSTADLGPNWIPTGESPSGHSGDAGPSGTDRDFAIVFYTADAQRAGANQPVWTLSESAMRAVPGVGAHVLQLSAGPWVCETHEEGQSVEVRANTATTNTATVSIRHVDTKFNNYLWAVWRRDGDYVLELFLMWHPAGLPFVPGRDSTAQVGITPQPTPPAKWLETVAEAAMAKLNGATPAKVPGFPAK